MDDNFDFTCPNCNQEMAIPSEYIGATLACPTCDKQFVAERPAPAIPEQPAPPPIPEVRLSGDKDCPFCGERIKAAAIKCKFCGEFFDGRSPQPVAAPTAARSTTSHVSAIPTERELERQVLGGNGDRKEVVKEEFKFACPHCGVRLLVEDDMAGQATVCPGCGEQFTVPTKRELKLQEVERGIAARKAHAKKAEESVGAFAKFTGVMLLLMLAFMFIFPPIGVLLFLVNTVVGVCYACFVLPGQNKSYPDSESGG